MLKKVNERFYSFLDKVTGMAFYLEYGEMGFNGNGRCWRLYYVHQGAKIFVACFIVKDDGFHSYKEGHESKLWKEEEAVVSANGMIAKIIE